MRLHILTGLVLAAGLSACASGPTVFPVQATRFHYDPVASRGTILVEPVGGSGAASIAAQDYVAAVRAELVKVGYTLPAPGAKPDNLATVDFRRTSRPLAARRSPLTIGVGGGFGGGGYSGGGVGVGGGVSFPVGKARNREGIVTDLSVRIRRGPDAIWEGTAQSMTEASAPGADNAAIAARLAGALFTGFPGESGRTIEVK